LPATVVMIPVLDDGGKGHVRSLRPLFNNALHHYRNFVDEDVRF